MTAKEAVDRLRTRMRSMPAADTELICALIEHITQLEQTLDLITGAIKSATRDTPASAVIRRASWMEP